MELASFLKLSEGNFTPSALYLFQTIDFNFMTQVDRVLGVISRHPLSTQNQTDIRQIALQSVHNNIPYFLQPKYTTDILFGGLNMSNIGIFQLQLKDRLIQLFCENIALTPTDEKIYDSYDIFNAVTPIEYMVSYMPYKATVTNEIMYSEESEEAMYRRGFLFPLSHYKTYMSKYLPLESIRLVRSLLRRMIDYFSLRPDKEVEEYLVASGCTEIDLLGLNKSLQQQVIKYMLERLKEMKSFGFANVYAIIMEVYSGFM